MASVCFYFQIHQPYRLRRYSVFDTDRHYFDEQKNAELFRKIAASCYLPANQTLIECIREHGGRFRIAYSITGTALEQIRESVPEVLESFQQLNATGCVEFLSETSHHSLSFLYSREEFRSQVEMHRALIKELFGQEPRVFRNTELIYNNDLGHFVAHMGYDAILTEGADHVLGARTPNQLYCPPHSKVKLLLKNYRLSDDIAFRFSNREWEQWPLTAEKFSQWVNQINGHGSVCNLFMDYETFGEHQWAVTGIFDFLRKLPAEILKDRANEFLTPAQVADKYESVGELDVPHMISWADQERDLSAWLGNAMQSNALHELYKLETALKEKGDPVLLDDWRRLTTSDHFYYMCTKYWADGDVHKYFSPYESPYDSYINFMNVLDNIQTRVRGTVTELSRAMRPSPTPSPLPAPLEPLSYAGPIPHQPGLPRPQRFVWGIFIWNELLMFALLGIFVLVLPRYEDTFRDFKIEMPLITRTMFQVRWLVVHGGFVLLLAFPVLLGFIAAAIPRERRWLLRAGVTLLMGIVAAFVILGLFLPLTSLVDAASSGSGKR